MGYTHYWYRPENIDPQAWRGFVKDAETILALSPVKLAPRRALPTEQEYTRVSPTMVRTNGAEPDDYETFLVERSTRRHRYPHGEPVFEFCKTGHRPYDVVVVALLCALKANVPETDLQSDGTRAERDAGITLYEHATAKQAPMWDCDAEKVEVT